MGRALSRGALLNIGERRSLCTRRAGILIAAAAAGVLLAPRPVAAQFATIVVDQISTARNTDNDDRDEVYFVLLGVGSRGHPVHIRRPRAGERIEESFGSADYYGMKSSTEPYEQALYGSFVPPPEPSVVTGIRVGEVHVPPEGYFLGCLLVAEQDGNLDAIGTFLLDLAKSAAGAAVGAIAGGVAGKLFPKAEDASKKKLRLLENESLDQFAQRVSEFNESCTTYAAQLRGAKQQVIGALGFALGFTSDGELLTHWAAPRSTETVILASNSNAATAVGTGHRAVYGFTARSEPTPLLSLRFHHSDKCLDVRGGAHGIAPVQQFHCHGSLNQKWLMRSVILDPDAILQHRERVFDRSFAEPSPGLEGVAFVSAESALCLDSARAPAGAVAHHVQQYPCHLGPAQLWVWEPQDLQRPAPTAPRRLRNLESWQCLDVADNSTADGADVNTYGCKRAADPTRDNQIIDRQ
jgi:hypothetical protein